jgi:hypothetical protein
MLFEEFFKKKKIDLTALQQGDQELFLEFKDHYGQMGEKSFDHTKKYWFNKLRRQYPLAPEVKVEKFKAENQIAEQTVTDTLTEPSPRNQAPDLEKTEPVTDDNNEATQPAPKMGFKPKFKPAAPAQPAIEDIPATPDAESTEASANETPAITPPKMGFKPRFKAGVTSAKPAEEIPEVAKPEQSGTPPEAPLSENTATPPPPKMGFKPRFKAGVTTAKPVEETTQPIEPTATPAEPAPSAESKDNVIPKEQPAPAKLGFKPRFKAGVTTTKPAAEEIEKAQDPAIAKEEPLAEDNPEAGATPENPTLKPAYKPRFNPNMIKRKPPEEE